MLCIYNVVMEMGIYRYMYLTFGVLKVPLSHGSWGFIETFEGEGGCTCMWSMLSGPPA